MTTGVIALVVLACALALFVSNIVPLPVTAMLAAISMAALGVMPFEDVFAAFSSQAVLLLIGMMVIGEAMTEVGVVETVVRFLERFLHFRERKILVLFCCAVAVVAAFSNALVVVAAILPVIDRICMESSGKLSRKRLYLPICVASYYGCTVTSIGASSMLNVSAQLEAAGFGRGLTFFEPAALGLPAVAVMILYASTVGYAVSRRAFHFKEIEPVAYTPTAAEEARDRESTRRYRVVLTVFVVTIALLLGTSIPYGVVAMAAAFILILARCVDMTVFQKISWSTIFTIVGSIGMGVGFAQSGAGELTTAFLMGIVGDLGRSPFFMCCLMMLITSLLSNLMSNNAAVSITCPHRLQPRRDLRREPHALRPRLRRRRPAVFVHASVQRQHRGGRPGGLPVQRLRAVGRAPRHPRLLGELCGTLRLLLPLGRPGPSARPCRPAGYPHCVHGRQGGANGLW